MARKGIVNPVLREKPELTPGAEEQYTLFSEIDKDGMSGRLSHRSMLQVLDEEGVTDYFDRRRRVAIWRAMERQIHKSLEVVKERERKEKEAEEAKEQSLKPGQRARVYER